MYSVIPVARKLWQQTRFSSPHARALACTSLQILVRSMCLSSIFFCLFRTPEKEEQQGWFQGRMLQASDLRLPWPSSEPAPHESFLAFPEDAASALLSAGNSLRP